MYCELWAYGQTIVIIPKEGEFGLVIGYDPSMEQIPGMTRGGPYAAKELTLQAVNYDRPGFGWKEYGYNKLSFNIPGKFASTILTFIFDYDIFVEKVNAR